MRALIAAIVVLCVLAPPASAAPKYRISEISLGTSIADMHFSSARPDDDTIRNLQTGRTMLVMVSGPRGGQAVRRLQIRLTGVACPENCTDKSWSLKLPGGITQTGFAGRTVQTPRWGCGKPVIRARVLLKDGSHSPWRRWKPNTVCD